MLARNPSERPSFDQVLDHVWVITAVKGLDLTDPKMHKAVANASKSSSMTKQSVPILSSEGGHRRIPELPPIRSPASVRSSSVPRSPPKKIGSHGRASPTKSLPRPPSVQSNGSLQFKSSGLKFDLRHHQPEMVI